MRSSNASILSEISSIEAEITIPASIQAQLTGVPSSVSAAFAEKTGLAQLYNSLIASPPAWLLTLPPAVQQYLISEVGPKIQNVASLEVAAGIITLPGAVGTGTGSSAKPTNGTGLSTGTGSATLSSGPKPTSKTTPKPTSPAATPIAGSSSSKAGAQPTGVIAAGLFGAVGFLGVAMAL
jgi:hypothetical protein